MCSLRGEADNGSSEQLPLMTSPSLHEAPWLCVAFYLIDSVLQRCAQHDMLQMMLVNTCMLHQLNQFFHCYVGNLKPRLCD